MVFSPPPGFMLLHGVRLSNMLDIREDVPLAPLTTFGIGGAARYFTEVSSEDELREALMWARGKALPHFVLAGGSNILFSDSTLEALVVRIAQGHHHFEGAHLHAEAGCTLLNLIKRSSILGLGGWESLSGIPGTIGGAVRGNAGAFGTEIKDVLFSARAMNTISFEVKVFSNPECDFAYRRSFFKDNPDWIILNVDIELKKVEAGDSIARIDNTIIERERRHLQNVRAAGSYFTNPAASAEIQKTFELEKQTTSRDGRVPAGWLIEKAGMKGASVGGAIASLQHPNYLVNTGGATAADVRELAQKIKDEVMSKFGIELREEAVVVAA